MLSTLASAAGVQWLSILVKAIAYGSTLVAAGSVVVLVTLRSLDNANRRAVLRLSIGAAVLAALVSVLLIPIQASFLMGGTLAGATNPVLIGMVSDSPLGSSIFLRLFGLGLILALVLSHRAGLWVALVGAVLVCASFALQGHALKDPRLLLGLLITLHILGTAFWIGAFAPLLHAAKLADTTQAGALAHEFGEQALWAVAGLVIVGAITLGLLTNWSLTALFSAYGQLFAIKLVVFAGVLGLAGWNKLRLTPALRGGNRLAAQQLRGSIRIEAALIGIILLTTAALTTLTSPPRPDIATLERTQNSAVLSPIKDRT